MNKRIFTNDYNYDTIITNAITNYDNYDNKLLTMIRKIYK